MNVLKAITIIQPYAELIARGEKRCENRTQRTRHRGLLVIHAGKSRAGLDRYRWTEPRTELDFGAIIAVAQLVDSVPLAEAQRMPELVGDPHVTGPWCWILSDVRRLPRPLPCPGQQWFWDVPLAIREEIATALG